MKFTVTNFFAEKVYNNAVTDKAAVGITVINNGTISAVSKAISKDATDEEKIAAAVSMLSNINKGNAEMITSMLTDSMLDKFGSNTENTQNAVDAVKNLVNNMADYKEGAPDDESVAKEAEAVTKLINVATTGTSNGPLFDTADGEKGALASDPDSLIDTIVGSEVVMQTMTDSVGDQESGSNPYGISYSSEEEKDSVAEALEKISIHGATHHSIMVYDAKIEEIEFFAKLLDIKPIRL